MELSRVGEATLRQSPSMLPYLVGGMHRPSTSLCSKAIVRYTRRQRATRSSVSSRYFSALRQLHQNDLGSRFPLDSTPTQQPGPTSKVTDELTNLLNATRSINSRSLHNTETSSTTPPKLSDGSNSSEKSLSGGDRNSGRLIDMGDDFWDLFGSPKGKTGLAQMQVVPEKNLPFKLNPSVGRTVRIDAKRGMDVGRAFRQLDIMCARNRVKRDHARQRFHERPGLKRKRLKSERWRRRFKEGFKALVQKAMAMKKQGW